MIHKSTVVILASGALCLAGVIGYALDGRSRPPRQSPASPVPKPAEAGPRADPDAEKPVRPKGEEPANVWKFPVGYAWFGPFDNPRYAAGFIEERSRQFFRWKDVTVDRETIPGDGAYTRATILDGNKLAVTDIDPPVFYQRLKDDQYAPGYLHPHWVFYRWKGVVIKRDELPALQDQSPGGLLNEEALRELEIVEIAPPRHMLKSPGRWKLIKS
jgi:hypothetical protein